MSTAGEDLLHIEQRSLVIGKWGNLVMGFAGVTAAWLSNSQAILVDGLFSLIGFASAIFAMRIAETARKGPDRTRPFGYAADESLFMMFRAFSLLGLVLTSSANAVRSIVNYALDGEAPELRFEVIIIYFVLVIIICFGLAYSHRRAWKKTGMRSEVLRMEASAAVFDGMISLAAGVCLVALPFLRDTQIGWITPVGDSVVVLFLCLLVVGRYWKDFRRGIAELVGATAPPKAIATARRAVRGLIAESGGELVDMSLVKNGRTYFAALYYDPQRAISADEIDALTRKVESALDKVLGASYAIIQVSKFGRAWGPDPTDAQVDGAEPASEN